MFIFTSWKILEWLKGKKNKRSKHETDEGPFYYVITFGAAPPPPSVTARERYIRRIEEIQRIHYTYCVRKRPGRDLLAKLRGETPPNLNCPCKRSKFGKPRK